MVVRQQDQGNSGERLAETETLRYATYDLDFNPAASAERKLFALLVEDAPENQFLMTKLLTNRGIEVELACNGAEGLDKALDADHDFILMDMEMPVLDGYNATRMLRELGYEKPIIALTAHSLPEEHIRILASGCDAHLTKPIDFLLLFRTITEFTQVEIELPLSVKASSAALKPLEDDVFRK